ncbi:hypothetical protein QCN29_36460 [Streptomyces sp. HNM0663]|uniref:RNA polymerase sigma factor 70 region 4 type 2 domain-containing protein n=1 Tax=Streptomyces chengmaiensis TaxID=3040919 RepID=A0ABT6I0C7_9ACTN|nr:hypothetical protein [Streptomyces chengmaiensis]MDH2394127.1 hypothetical protein [Streptomyces chengmaiensis]
MTICLPLDYTAFCVLYQEDYLRYAHARTAEAQVSSQAVQTALEDLAQRWTAALGACPEAVAWQLLGRAVSSACRGRLRKQAAEAPDVYGVLPVAQADSALLCWVLTLPAKRAAHLMGVEEAAVCSLLSAARRRLSAARPDALLSCL